MRATFFGFELGKRAVLAQRTAMEVTSHNIANANTEGYARQNAVLGPTGSWAIPDFYAPVTAQQIGTGVDVYRIESYRDAFIDKKITNEKSTLEERSAADDIMKNIEAIFNEPNDGTLRSQLDKFWASWEDLSISADRPELRRNVVEQAQSLITIVKDIDLRLRRLQGAPDLAFQGSIENQIDDSLRQINNLARQISTLNLEIEHLKIADARPNDLIDSRQKLLEELSGLMKIDSIYDSLGHLTVRSGENVLLQNGRVYELSYFQKDADQPGTIAFGEEYPEFSDNSDVATAILTHSEAQRNVTVSVEQTAQANSKSSYLTYFPLDGPLSEFGITSGTFQLQGREFTLDAENTSMEELVDMINDGNVHVTASLNQSGQLVLESQLSGTANALITANGTSNLYTVMNLQEEKAARDAKFNIGNQRFVRSSNEVRDALDGVTLFVNKMGVANLDLRPTITGGKIQGLLKVRDLNLLETREQLDEFTWRLITEVNAAHRQGYGLDGETGRNFFTPLTTNDTSRPYKNAMKNFGLETFIVSDLNTLAAASGTFVNPTDRLRSYNGDGDGANAIQISQVKHKQFFNKGKADFNEFYNEIVTKVATESQEYGRNRQGSEDLITMLEAKRQELSGVSLDEELANIIKFQHAYNAAARIITTMDSMLDKVINQMLR